MAMLGFWTPLALQTAWTIDNDLYQPEGHDLTYTTQNGVVKWPLQDYQASSYGARALADTGMTAAYYFMRFQVSALPTATPRGWENIAYFGLNSSTAGPAVVLNENGTLSLGEFSDSSYTILDTTTLVIEPGIDYKLECEHTDQGAVTIKLDGVEILTASIAWDNPDASQGFFYLGSFPSVRGNSSAMSIVIYVWDLAMASNNWIGEGGVYRIPLGSNGFYADWTQGTGTTAAEIDEYPRDGDVTYLKTDVTGRASFTLTSVPGFSSIQMLRVFSSMRNEVSGGGNGYRAFVRTSSVNYDILNQSVTPSTQYNLAAWSNSINPSTSSAWTYSDLTTSEFGISHSVSTTKATRLTNMGVLVWGTVPPIEVNLVPAVLHMGTNVPDFLRGPILEPVTMKLGTLLPAISMGAISLNPVALHLFSPAVASYLVRSTLPTVRGQWWTVSPTAPVVKQEGYIWVDTSNEADPRIMQQTGGLWVDAISGYAEAVIREVFDGGGSSSSTSLVTIVNITGLNIPADRHIIIDALFANTNGVTNVTDMGIQLNGVDVMTAVAAPENTFGEIGTWRIIIPRRDSGDLGGKSYLWAPTVAASQTITTLTNVPQNAPITSIALRADPNGTAFEIRNVLVRSLTA